MHETAYEWVERCVKAHGLAGTRTLEVGSYNVNGSVRGLFTGPYTGLDMREGPGVDIVSPACHLPFKGETFETVVSTSTLEHDFYFWKTIPEMYRVLKPEGMLVLTTVTFGWVKHEHPYDYWRFSEEAMEGLLCEAGFLPLNVHVPTGEGALPDLFVLAKK